MDVLSFGCGAPQAQPPDHPSFSVRVEPRQEAEGSCVFHAVVVLFLAEQAGPQSTSFGISTPDSGTSSGVQVGLSAAGLPQYAKVRPADCQACHCS